MRIQTEKRSLPTELTPEELAVEAQNLAAAVEKAAEQEEAIAEAKGVWSEKKKAMEGYLSHLKDEANTLAAIVDSGKAEREVQCSWIYALGAGYAFLLRDDTGKLVTARKLGDAERQADLLEVIREPTPEQLAGWVESLGLTIDPQQGLPLAAPAAVSYFKAIPTNDDTVICGRFNDADHRPSSLTGVYLAEKGEPLDQLEALSYDDDADLVQKVRGQLEDILEARKAEALKSRQEPEGGTAEPPKRKGGKK